MVASAVLVFSVVSPVRAAESAPAEDVFEPGIVPLVPSPAVEMPASTIPEGDFSDLAAEAAATPSDESAGHVPSQVLAPEVSVTPRVAVSESGEIRDGEVVDRSEFQTVYENPDGSQRTVVSTGPINAKNDEGDWVPVSTHLSAESDGSWSTDAHPLDPTFESDTDGGVFSVTRDGYHVSFELLDADTAYLRRAGLPWSNTGDQVSYDDVFDGVDLDFDVERAGIKETLVLSDVPDRADASWTWLIKANALDVRHDEFGNIEFVNRYGEVQFHIPAPVMWDSSGLAGQSEDELANVPTTLTTTDDGWELTLTPSYGWLSDPDRVCIR